MSAAVSFTRDGEIGVITVANPPVNALSQPVRAGLKDFTEVTGSSGKTAVATQEDVFFWIHSNRHDRNFEVALAARRAFAPIGALARETPSWVYLDSRDLTGFIDGTENPTLVEAMGVALIASGSAGSASSIALGKSVSADSLFPRAPSTCASQ